MITVTSKLFFFLTHKYTNSAFRSWILFFTAPIFFRISFPDKPTCRRSLSDSQKHKVPQSVLYMLLLSRAPQDSIDTTVLSCLFLLCNIRTAKISYCKKYIFQSAP